MNLLDTLHFLRPHWLLLLPLTLAAAGLWWHRAPQRTRWSQICDPELLPHLLSDTDAGQRSRHPWLMLTLAALVPLAMAGPAWKRLPQPVFEVPQDVVLVMDLSQSMAAADVRPSRLDRARFAAHDLLEAQHEGQTALVAFAGSAFAVVPLTTDRRTVAHLLDSLDTTLMPHQGSRIDTGLSQARELIDNAASHHATVVVLTDSPGTPAARAAATALRDAGHEVDVIGIGTAAGAPVPLPAGGWATQGDDVALARLDEDSLRDLARAGGGRYQTLATQADVAALVRATADRAGESKAADLNADQWRDEGFWLILLALPLIASGFRRGALMIALLTLPLLQPQPAYAWEWQSLWRNADQRGHERLNDDPAAAAELFADPEWAASAHYRAGHYQQAAQLFETEDSAIGHYNRGNALARAGQLQAALDAYDEALQRDPDFTDARDNRELVQKLLDDQQEQQQDDGSDNAEPQDGDNQQSSQSQDGESQQQSEGGDDARESGQEQASPAQDGESPSDQTQSSASDPDLAQESDEQPDQTSTDPSEQGESDEPEAAQALAEPTEPTDEATQAMEQWLRRVPDDPGGLLREKFRRQQQRRQPQSEEATRW